MEQIENVLPFPFSGGMQEGSPSDTGQLPSRLLSTDVSQYLIALAVAALTF